MMVGLTAHQGLSSGLNLLQQLLMYAIYFHMMQASLGDGRAHSTPRTIFWAKVKDLAQE